MEKEKNDDVLLINMPFGITYHPSLGLSILKEALTENGYSSKIKYYNIEFASRIGLENYLMVSSGKPYNYDLFGEWLFSDSIFAISAVNFFLASKFSLSS